MSQALSCLFMSSCPALISSILRSLRFYLMDNQSSDNLTAEVSDYVGRGIVQHTLFGTGTSEDYDPQTEAYRRCLEMASGHHTWLGAWDTDEFLIVPDGLDLAVSQSAASQYRRLWC